MPLKGQDRWKKRMQALASPDLVRKVERVLYVGADMIRAHAHREISRGSVSGKNHVPSKPGEYPNRDTGVLQSNLESQLTGRLTAEVRSKAPYAGALERGTSKMAARPHIRPARDAKIDEVRKLFAKTINRHVKQS